MSVFQNKKVWRGGGGGGGFMSIMDFLNKEKDLFNDIFN